MSTHMSNSRSGPPKTPTNVGAPSPEEVQAQLERILGHRDFEASGRTREFLRFVVEETLAGRRHRLKGYTIAVEVFGRAKDFDANLDPIVRIQAGRLRRALERYYLVAGGDDPVLITVPKGGAEGMIVTSGGRFAGWGFYLLKGKPVFCWNLLDL